MANDYQAVTSGGCKPSTQDLERNAPLLVGYEYEKYVTCITGYNGMNLQQITACQHFPAVRVRIGPPGNYKAGFCRLEDGTLILASCRLVNDEFQIYVYESRDEGLTWNEIGETELYGKEPCLTLLPDGSLFLTAQPPKTPVLDNTQVVSYRSTDNAVNWETFIIDGPDYPRSIIVELDGSLLMVRSKMATYARGAYEEAGKPFTPSSNLELIRSSDGGQTWKSRTKGLPRSSVNVLTRSKTRLFCGTRDGLFLSEDGGKSWSRCEGVYPIDITAVQANPFDPGQVVAADSVANHLFHSADGGIRWKAINLGTERSTIVSLTFSPLGELLAGTLSEGVYRIEQVGPIPADDQ